MITRTYVNAKIHGIRVTDKSIHYHGSVTIGRDFMELAGIDEYEQVDIVDLNNGNRWTTYAIAGPEGVFTLNGGGARLGEIGDECVIMTYAQSSTFRSAEVVHVNRDNQIVDLQTYTSDAKGR